MTTNKLLANLWPDSLFQGKEIIKCFFIIVKNPFVLNKPLRLTILYSIEYVEFEILYIGIA